MTTATVIVLWTAAFAATHIGLSSLKIRSRLVGTIGLAGYVGLYSLVSLATFVPLVMAWLEGIHGGGMLWNLRKVPGVQPVGLFVSWLSFSMALASLVQPSPAAAGPRLRTRAYGLTRITRHPLFMNLGIWGLAHVILNGYLNDVLFFGGIFAVGLLGCLHQDSRKRVTENGTLDEFFAETSVTPFAAIVAGRGHFAPSELPWIALAVTGIASAALYHFHTALFF